MIWIKNLNFMVLSSFSAILFIIILSCAEDEIITQPFNDNNLITNGSFENKGLPSLNGWHSSTTDTSYINFSNDVPPAGGYFSAKLLNAWTFAGTIEQEVVLPAGTQIYKLSAWAKKTSQSWTGGVIMLLLKTAGVESVRKYSIVSDTTWTHHSIKDTLATSSTDTIIIRLRGALDQFSGGYTYFDLCRFEKSD